MIKIIKKSLNGLAYATIFQSISNFTSMPFLVANGIAIPLLGIIGNIIFAPVLLVFMLVGSGYFFCELVGINSWVFSQGLEFICLWWTKALKVGHNYQLFFSYKDYFAVLALQLLAGFTIFYQSRLISIHRKLIAFSIASQVIYFLPFKRIFAPKHPVELVLKKITLTANQAGNEVLINNHPKLKRLLKNDYFVKFELEPAIIKTFGTNKYALGGKQVFCLKR